MSEHSALVNLLGGIAVFMYGMQLAGNNLQKLAENKVRDLIGRISNRNYVSIVVGIALTTILQSSGAVTSLLVNLGRAKVISLSEVMGVVIGAAVGSTLTVQLISFKVTDWGFGIFAASFVLYFITNKSQVRSFFAIFMGFGLVFWGLELMGFGTSILKSNENLQMVFEGLGAYPLWALVATAIFTGFVHSSAVVIGLAMSLTMSGVMSFYDAMFWVYGANIGTTATALMTAIGGNYVARRVAWAHFFYKFGSVVIFIGVTQQFASLMESSGDNLGRSIANAHTVFNILAAIIFYPFIGVGVKYIVRFIKPRKGEKGFRVKYMRRDSEEPFLLISDARREALRMGDIVLRMVRDSLSLFRVYNTDLVKEIRERDNQVDLLHREIKMRLVGIKTDNNEIEKSVIDLIEFTSDLESAADVVDKSLLRLSGKKHDTKLEFSPQGWRELEKLHENVVEMARLAIASFGMQTDEVSSKMIAKKRELRELEKKFKISHFKRLQSGLRESIKTSEIHLDVLGEYRRITGLLTNHAYYIAESEQK